MTIESTGKLEQMSMMELIEIYNAQPGIKAVTKFRDKETAVRRVLAALAETNSTGAAKPEKPVEVRTKKLPGQGQGSGRRRKPFDILPGDKIRPHRKAGTKRAALIELLSGEGATFEEVMETIKWDRRTATDGIKLLHKQLGYGINEKASGKIVLVLP